MGPNRVSAGPAAGGHDPCQWPVGRRPTLSSPGVRADPSSRLPRQCGSAGPSHWRRRASCPPDLEADLADEMEILRRRGGDSSMANGPVRASVSDRRWSHRRKMAEPHAAGGPPWRLVVFASSHSSFVNARTRWPSPVNRVELPGVPRPQAVDLDFEREAQHDSDQHDQSEHPDALQRLIDQDRPDDVSDDQHLKAKQDHPPKIGAQLPKRVRSVRANLLRVKNESNEATDDHDRASDALNDLDHLAGDILVAHPPTLATALSRAQTNGIRFATRRVDRENQVVS